MSMSDFDIVSEVGALEPNLTVPPSMSVFGDQDTHLVVFSDSSDEENALGRESPFRHSGRYEPAVAVASAYALRWVPYAAAVSAVRALLGASHEDLRDGAHQLSRFLSGTFFDGAAAEAMPPPFAACDRFSEEELYVCADRPPLAPALLAVNRALTQVAAKDAEHHACDWYYDVVRDLMLLLVDDAGVGAAVMDQAKFEAAFALQWIPE